MVPLSTTNSVPQHCNAEFLRGIVMLSHLNTWAIAAVGPVNFGIKYFVGRARPEEVAYQIATGELTLSDGVPQDLLDIILQFELDQSRRIYRLSRRQSHASILARHAFGRQCRIDVVGSRLESYRRNNTVKPNWSITVLPMLVPWQESTMPPTILLDSNWDRKSWKMYFLLIWKKSMVPMPPWCKTRLQCRTL